ncbi:MAG: hypothetical protein AAB696_01525 [Patescibacteria group bacterium]
MITEYIKTINNFKLQTKPCPTCGEEEVDDVCPACNPEEIDEIKEEVGADSDEELI